MRPRSSIPEPPAPAWLPLAAAGLVGLFVCLATASLLSESQTSDEAIHLAAGYAHLTRADFAINPEHPPLAKEIAALPLLFLDVRLPVDHPSWEAAHRSSFQLPLGERFLHHNGVPFTTMLSAGRLPIVALGALLCLTVFRFSRRLFGWRGGLLSLALACLCPNLIAHSRLVTTDVAVSLFFLLTFLCLDRFLMAPGRARLLLTGAAAGLTLSSKFSAVIVLPALLLALLMAPSGAGRPLPRRHALRAFAAMSAVAVGVLGLTYAVVSLPVYLAGLAGVFGTVTGGSEAFLLGRISSSGWWYYYPVAMALKTPVPALLLFAAIPWLYAGGRRSPMLRRHAVLLLPGLLFLAASLLAARNVGLRHVLPLYPILFVLAGGAAGPIAGLIPGAMTGRLLVAALMLWQAGSALGIHPFYLAYFNELGGGPSRAWRLLSDSNVDWGQDFFRLRQFMQREGVDEILLGFYGNQDPTRYGITYQHLPGEGHIKPPPGHLVSSSRILAVVSVMTLQGMFMRDRQTYRWLQERVPMAKVGYSLYVYDLTRDREGLQILADLYQRRGMAPQAGWARSRAAGLTSSPGSGIMPSFHGGETRDEPPDGPGASTGHVTEARPGRDPAGRRLGRRHPAQRQPAHHLLGDRRQRPEHAA